MVLEDLPPNFRSTEIVKALAVLCGGLDGKEDQIFFGNSWEDEFRFKAIINDNGFIPRGCFITQDGVDFRIRFARFEEEGSRPESRPEKKKLVIGDDAGFEAAPSHTASWSILRKTSEIGINLNQKPQSHFKQFSGEIQNSGGRLFHWVVFRMKLGLAMIHLLMGVLQSLGRWMLGLL